jgi:hypothetical protein
MSCQSTCQLEGGGKLITPAPTPGTPRPASAITLVAPGGTLLTAPQNTQTARRATTSANYPLVAACAAGQPVRGRFGVARNALPPPNCADQDGVMSERFIIGREGCGLAGERWLGNAQLVALLHEGVSDRRGLRLRRICSRVREHSGSIRGWPHRSGACAHLRSCFPLACLAMTFQTVSDARFVQVGGQRLLGRV